MSNDQPTQPISPEPAPTPPNPWLATPPPRGLPAPTPYPGYPYVAPRTADSAVWALVCAIGSWLVCPVVLAVAAVVLAQAARTTIRQSGGSRTGDGLVTAAQIIAWANIAVGALMLLFGLAIVIGIAIGAN